MRKKFFGLLTICLVVVLAVLAIVRIKKENNGDLKKVTVADTTLTSLTIRTVK